MKKSPLIMLCCIAMSAMAPLASAQDNPPKHIRFLALGERFPWKGKLINGVRVGQPPPKGAEPPKTTTYLSGNQVVPFQMNLRTFTKVLKMEANTKRLEVKAGDEQANNVWFTRPMPTAPLSLAIVYPDPATMKWNGPKVLVLDDDLKSFTPGQIRFVNVSDKKVLVKLGSSVSKVDPGKALTMAIKEGATPALLGYLNGKKQEVIFNNDIKVLRNQRMQCFFFKPRTPKLNQEVLVMMVPEPAPKIQ